MSLSWLAHAGMAVNQGLLNDCVHHGGDSPIFLCDSSPGRPELYPCSAMAISSSHRRWERRDSKSLFRDAEWRIHRRRRHGCPASFHLWCFASTAGGAGCFRSCLISTAVFSSAATAPAAELTYAPLALARFWLYRLGYSGLSGHALSWRWLPRSRAGPHTSAHGFLKIDGGALSI